MSSAGPWSVKGIDPKAREIAKDQARRSGQTLGEWLNARIIEGDEALADAEAPRAAAPQALSAPASSAVRAPAPADLRSLARALDALSQRMESAEARSAQAVAGIDRKVAGVLKRLDGADAKGSDAAGRLDEVREAQAKLAERLGRADAADAPRRDALKALESALGKVAAQIYEGESRARAQMAETRGDLAALGTRVEGLDARAHSGPGAAEIERRFADMAERLASAEARTESAVRALETSFAGLDQRLATAEAAPAQAGAGVSEARFEKLAASLSDQVDVARAEMADRIREAAGGGLERMEAALRELAGDVSAAETRQVRAIDTMGREVVRIASSLNGRLGGVETRQSEGEARVAGEVARMAQGVEARLRRGDEAQAAALERLGGEIARIAETLADRIGASERRTAQAAEDMGDQLRDVTARLNARHEAAAAEFAERMRANEARTAQLLDAPAPEADAPVAPAPQPVAAPAPKPLVAADVEVPPAPPPPTWNMAAAAHPAQAAFDPFAGFEAEAAPFADDFGAPQAGAAAMEDAPEAAQAAAPPAHDPFTAYAHDERITRRHSGDEDEGDDIFEAPRSAPARASTRELIDQARQAARAAAEARGGRRGRGEPDALAAPGFEPPAARGLPTALPWLKKREASGGLRTAVVASLVASSTVALAVGAVSLAGGEHGGPATTGEAPSAASSGADAGGQLAMAVTAPDPALSAPDAGAGAADAGAPTLTHGADAAASPASDRPDDAAHVASEAKPAAAPSGAATAKLAYADAVRRIQGGDAASGVATLKRTANLGYGPAQLYLAKLYEDGRAGLPKDAGQARAWTTRAAENGDAHAMFNLGMFYATGDGGPKNDPSAAAWFRRAADLGLHDAQYNMAVMAQSGRGVPKNLADAYKWYLVAAAQGDTGARQSADAIKGELSAEQRTAAERAAGAYPTQVASSQPRSGGGTD